MAAAGALAALGLAAVVFLPHRGAPPPPAPAPGAEPLAGSQSCRSCHAVFFQKWSTSFHGLAMQPHTGDFARDRLTPQEKPLVIGGRSYRAVIGTDADHVEETGPGGKRTHPIVQVLGGKNVCYFLTPLDRGLLQVLPVAYDMNRKEWFSTTASAVRHFAGVTNEELDWTDRAYTFNTSCFSCHVSQLATNYEPATDSYRTVWAEPGVSCETCHGPAGEHVKAFQGLAPGVTPPDWKIISVKKLAKEQRSDLCASCHAKASPLWTAFRPGDRFFDHFDLTTLENRDYYPDGRDLGENYTFTSWRMSPCVRSGRIDCVHCHTSSGRYKFKDQPNDACLPCHEERVKNAAAHTHHEGDGPGTRCTDCHMPKTEFARMRRSDHSMRPPAPAATRELGSPNACNGLPRGPRRGLGREGDPLVGPRPMVGADPARGTPRGGRAQGGLVAPAGDARLPEGDGAGRGRHRLARAAPRRVRGRLEVAGVAGARRGPVASRARGGGHRPRGRPLGTRSRPRCDAGRPAARPRAGRAGSRHDRPANAAGDGTRGRPVGPGRARASRSSPGPTTSPRSTTSATCTSSGATRPPPRTGTARHSRCGPTT